MDTLVFATGNAHKLQEIRAILGHQFEIKSLNDIVGRTDLILTALPTTLACKSKPSMGSQAYSLPAMPPSTDSQPPQDATKTTWTTSSSNSPPIPPNHSPATRYSKGGQPVSAPTSPSSTKDRSTTSRASSTATSSPRSEAPTASATTPSLCPKVTPKPSPNSATTLRTV